jgi:hypothetical protein
MKTTAAADTNVRLGRRLAVATTRGMRRLVLARLLLQVLRPIQLDRKLLLLLVPLMPACIIPAGPEFQDPEGVANSPPEMIAVTPMIGSAVISDMFSITVGDANGDQLHVRWMADYPGTSFRWYQMDDPSSVAPAGQPRTDRFDLKATCDSLDPSLTSHTIMVVVGDRPFVDGSDDKTQVVEGGKRVVAFWIWNVTCNRTSSSASR